MKLLVLKAGEVFIHDKSGTDNLTFLFNQVVHQHLRYPEHDPWSYLTGRILELATTVAELEALNVSMGTATHGVVLSYWTMKYLTDRFTSGSGLNQSMLDKFAASVTLYTLLGGEEAAALVSREASDICYCFGELYHGESIGIRVDTELGTKRGVVASSVVDRRRILFSINRTVLDDIYSFFAGVPSSEAEAAKALVQSAVMNMFFGRGKMVVINPTLSLIEFGLARVGEYGKRVQWIQDGEDADNANAGPDIWFFLNLVDDKDGDEELVICAAQMKTSDRTFREANDMLDFEKLFRHGTKTIKNPKDAKAAKLIQDFPHHLKLVVTSAYVNLEKVKPDIPLHPTKRRKAC
ncbi:hypothetical protein SELMODRAFT_413146 [Selaginella moellendorffii]|uniref:Uncharacterized protein n=1 Tax=Selaginella moellendorffii TaxID=88036 RepID=D8RNH8_SELML|nr:hypothetical protein SELMODRAFT_413146 [Selaginella moellendorffii]